MIFKLDKGKVDPIISKLQNLLDHLDNLLLDLWDQVSAYVSKTICEPVKSSWPASYNSYWNPIVWSH